MTSSRKKWVKILIGVGVAAAVALVAVYMVLTADRKKRTDLTTHKVQTALSAVKIWRVELPARQRAKGPCPTDLSVLVPSHLKSNDIKDAWGEKLKLRCSPKRVCVYSTGHNKRDEKGGGDDIQECSE